MGAKEVSPSEAAALLGVVSVARRRARIARQQLWLVGILLGCALIVGATVQRLPQPMAFAKPCPSGELREAGGHCVGMAINHSSHSMGTVSGSISGTVSSPWSLGNSWWYWVLALSVTFATLLVARRLQRPWGTFLRDMALLAVSLLSAAGVDLLLRTNSGVSPYASVVTVGVAVAFIAGFQRSHALGLLGLVVLAVALVTYWLVPVEELPANLSVPIPSMMDAITGSTLILGAMALRIANGAVAIRFSTLMPASSQLVGG